MSQKNMSFAGLMSLLSQTSKVRIVGNKDIDGNPIVTPMVDANNNAKTDNNGNPLGTIMLEQDIREYTGSFVNARKRVAFVSGTMEELNKIVTQANLKDGTELSGRICVIESLEPMYKGQQPKINPSTGEVHPVVANGREWPIYRQTRYMEDNNAPDFMINDEASVNAWLMNKNINVEKTVVTGEAASIPA